MCRWTSGVNQASTCWPHSLWTNASHRMVLSQHCATSRASKSQLRRTSWQSWPTCTTSMRWSCPKTFVPLWSRHLSAWRTCRRCLRSDKLASRGCRPSRPGQCNLWHPGLSLHPKDLHWRTRAAWVEASNSHISSVSHIILLSSVIKSGNNWFFPSLPLSSDTESLRLLG